MAKLCLSAVVTEAVSKLMFDEVRPGHSSQGVRVELLRQQSSSRRDSFVYCSYISVTEAVDPRPPPPVLCIAAGYLERHTRVVGLGAGERVSPNVIYVVPASAAGPMPRSSIGPAD